MQIQPLLDNLGNRKHLPITIFTFLCFLALTYGLDEVPPYHADENFYVTSSSNMIETNDYITPTYHGKKRFAKPILFYWLVAASYKTFGTNLYSARLVSSIFGTLCIPIVYIIARRLFDHKTATISALLLPGCYLHFQISRWAITDMALNFFILSTFYFFIRGIQDQSNKATSYCFAYICMGIGFMIKGPVAIIIPILVIGCYLLITQNWGELSKILFGYGVIILTAIILPWFVTMLIIHGDDFTNHILGAELRDRIIHKTPLSLYYLGVVVRYHLPWSFFFIAALAIKFRLALISSLSSPLKKNYLPLSRKLTNSYNSIIHNDNRAFLFSTIWILVPLLFFTLFRIEHSRYMLSVSVPISMISAHFFSQLIESPSGFKSYTFKVLFYLTLIFYLLIAILAITAILLLLPHFKTPIGLMVLFILGLIGPAVLFILYKLKKYFFMIIALSIIQIIFLTAFSSNALAYFNRYPMKLFANQILSDPQSNKHIGLYQLGNNRARIGVLTALPAIYLNNPKELKLFIKSNEIVYIVMRQSEWKENFLNLPLRVQAVDSGWKKSKINKAEIQSFLMSGLAFQLEEYSENYILLKKIGQK